MIEKELSNLVIPRKISHRHSHQGVLTAHTHSRDAALPDAKGQYSKSGLRLLFEHQSVGMATEHRHITVGGSENSNDFAAPL